MAVSASKIIGLIVGLLVLGLLLPIGMVGILEFTSTNTTVQTIVTSLLPILVIVGIILAIVPKGGSE
jgi:hypothetical protein